jgi:hypothetical protein
MFLAEFTGHVPIEIDRKFELRALNGKNGA